MEIATLAPLLIVVLFVALAAGLWIGFALIAVGLWSLALVCGLGVKQLRRFP